ncbi:MAG: ATP-binding protein [Candidatus Chromulinivorax sp.]|nr:ATP-binding protein [Candidatus Chromulinivorax sp.]
MNLKKSIFRIITFIFIFNAQAVYTKDQQDDNNLNNSRSAITADYETSENTAQFDAEMWQFTEETFQTITDQTQQIEFCLQTIEQIINADKLKFDSNKISKAQLLEEIKYVKHNIKNIYTYFTTKFSKYESIILMTCYNAIFIEYLLLIFKNNISDINAEKFQIYIEKNIENIATKLQDPMQLPVAIENNTTNLQLLMHSSENIGLSTLNRLYNYLDTVPLPLYGKSTIATAKDVTLWGGAALLIYSMAIYGLPKDSPIYGTNWKISDLWGKSIAGDFHEVLEKRHPGVSEERRIELINDFGVYSYLHDGTLTYADPFMLGTLGTLSWLIKKPALEALENAKKSLDYGFNYYIKGDITPPKHAADMAKTYFTDMIGSENLEKLARELTDYLKNPTRYERAGISPSTGYLLVGPSQTGKSFFAKALKTMIDEEFEGTNQKVKFAVITSEDLQYSGGFTDIFYWARKKAPIILFMDEIDMFGTRRDRDAKNTQELLTAMNGMETDPSKKVIVIAATNRPEELDFALKQKGRLGTVITFDVPTYECRKIYLEKQLSKRNIIVSSEMIDTIAQETDGQTYNMIDDIIKQALQLATFQKRTVQEADLEITLDREIRKIKPNTTMSAQEQELVAIYQAGQAAARHVLATDQQIVKITINTVDKPMKSKEGFGVVHEQKGDMHENHELLPQIRIKPTRLGFVFTMSKTNNHELISDIEQEKELMALLAGQAALELIKGTTFNGFGKEDRAKVIEALERKISQGTPITDTIRQQAIAAKDILYQKAKQTLQKHVGFIKTITNELIQHHTIATKQWLEIAANYKI